MKTFEDFLKEKFADETQGKVLDGSTPDPYKMPGEYDRWLGNLSADEFIHWADEFTEQVRKGLDKPIF